LLRNTANDSNPDPLQLVGGHVSVVRGAAPRLDELRDAPPLPINKELTSPCRSTIFVVVGSRGHPQLTAFGYGARSWVVRAA